MNARRESSHALPGGLPFALAAVGEQLCFISGMPALGEDGAYRPGTFEEEVASAWAHVERIASAAGYGIADVVFVQCVLSDIGDYDRLNTWWRRTFPDAAAAPARFTFQAGALPFGCRVELQAVAGRHRAVIAR